MEELDFATAEQALATASFGDCRPIWYSSNYVFLAQLHTPDGEAILAVYKPERGEAPLWDFPDGKLYRRELAAYRLARALHWNFVPPTVVRDGPEGIGAVQLFVPHDPHAHYFEQRERPELVPQLQRIALFDAVANNADRKAGHCLLDPTGKVWAIDHGLCFHHQYKLRTVIWDWADEPIPPVMLRELRRFASELQAESPRLHPFLELLRPIELRALWERLERLLDRGRFPLPGPHRSYPWPLV